MMGNFTCTRLVNILLGIRPILCFFMNLKPYKLLNTLKHSFGWSGGGGGIWHWQIGTREHLSHRFCNIQTKGWKSLVFHIIILVKCFRNSHFFLLNKYGKNVNDERKGVFRYIYSGNGNVSFVIMTPPL